MDGLTRRGAVGMIAGSMAFPSLARAGAKSARVVLVGAGFGGAAAAQELLRLDPRLDITIIEPRDRCVTCPYSNMVLAGWRDMASISVSFQGLLGRKRVRHIRDAAVDIDPEKRRVRLYSGKSVPYDRLIVASGIGMRFDAISYYNETATSLLPHGYLPGPQTVLLRNQLEAMEDGGSVLICPPKLPYRCPPSPYERASLIADYLKREKPRSKIVILDAKEQFPMQELFREAWDELYPGMIEWRSGKAGEVVAAYPDDLAVETASGERLTGDVVNVIPPQRAGSMTAKAGLSDATGWCPVDARTLESALMPDVHIVGDSMLGGDVPKTAVVACDLGELAARAVVAALGGQAAPREERVRSVCYAHAGRSWAMASGKTFLASAAGFIEESAKARISKAGDRDARRRDSAEADAQYNGPLRAMFAA